MPAKIAVFLPASFALASCGTSTEPPSVANATAMMADNLTAMAADLERHAQASATEPTPARNATDPVSGDDAK